MTTVLDDRPNSASPSEPAPAWLVERETRRDGWTILMFGLSAMALLTAVIGVGFGVRAIQESKSNRPAAGGSRTAINLSTAPSMVHLSEFKIEPADVRATTAGGLEIMNTGAVAHNLAIEGQDVASPPVEPGQSAKLALSALAPGSYTMFCTIPGHREAGMTATLQLTAADAAASQSAAPAAGTGHAMSADEMDTVMARATKAFPAKTAGLGAQPLAPTVLADGTKQFELTSKVVKWEVEPGKRVDAWTYNGAVPGPTMHVNPGDKVRVVLHNELPESTAIHFHGLRTPNAMDGVPDITQKPVKPGETFTYEFTAQATPAVGMYHSHQNAVKQVPNGLAGAFLIGDLPLPAGVQVAQQQIMMLNDSGTIGFSLNGKSFPATAPVAAKLGDWVEVHYLNEGTMAHPMHLHGLVQTVIAKDGFPLAQPQDEDTVVVSPGERFTVLVHADSAGVWAWHCHILSHAERSDGMFGMVTAMVVKS